MRNTPRRQIRSIGALTSLFLALTTVALADTSPFRAEVSGSGPPMLLIPGLPIPQARQRHLAATLTGGLVVLQLLQTATSFFSFADESAGLRELLDQAEPGQALAGLISEPGATAWTEPAVLEHFPAFYQVLKGGRVHFSFVQFFNSPVKKSTSGLKAPSSIVLRSAAESEG